MSFRYRRLMSSYAKGGITTPTDIAGLQLWLDFSDAATLFTDAGSTPVSSDGDAIYQANDKSGQGNHVTQSTEIYRPLYKTGIQNGLSVSRYDGSNDYLHTTLTGFTANQPMTAFVVCYENGKSSVAGDNPLWEFGSDIGGVGDRRTVLFAFDTTSCDAIRLYGGNTQYPDTTYQTWYAYAHRYNGDGAAFDGWLDGASLGIIDSGIGDLNIQTGDFWLGYNENQGGTEQNLYGSVGEMIFCYGALSDSDIASVYTYLNNKWAIY